MNYPLHCVTPYGTFEVAFNLHLPFTKYNLSQWLGINIKDTIRAVEECKDFTFTLEGPIAVGVWSSFHGLTLLYNADTKKFTPKLSMQEYYSTDIEMRNQSISALHAHFEDWLAKNKEALIHRFKQRFFELVREKALQLESAVVMLLSEVNSLEQSNDNMGM